jgi:4-aminobutyrate aminotransferase-like enzyme
MIVVDDGYHGNTTTLVEMSPYKYAGPGGGGRPQWVHQVELPDVYRGRHRDPQTAGLAYAADVERALADAAGRAGAAAFICESLLGCGGQVPLPAGYLAAALAAVRAHGAVYIADEVQVGFGRVGTHRWGFETHGVVPDIVTLGKPMGNGHPIGAVVTTPAIAASFDTGMEYFNTFGGNPVSCAIGLAVLDVLEEEQLQERARAVGEGLTEGLRELEARHAVIGDVRGLGLFLGVELVEDRETREPATALTRAVVGQMKDEGVLVTSEGPHDNVLKIKPPLAFTPENASFFVEQLDSVLHRLRPS